MMTDTVPAAPWFRHRWPWLLMLGPAVVVVASAASAWLAATRPDALVDGDYYKRGKAINQDLRRAHAAGERGIGMDLGYDATTDRLAGSVRDVRGPLADRLKLRLLHPTIPARDIQLLFTSDAEGRFSAALPLLERARWQVVLEDADGKWRMEGHWLWPAEARAQLQAVPAVAAH